MSAGDVSEGDEDFVGPKNAAQEKALKSEADILFFGGSMGGSKTATLLLESMRHIDREGFNAVLLRRERPMITRGGGMWDESFKFYAAAGGSPKVGKLIWNFPSGAKIQFDGIQYESDLEGWKGSQIAMFGIDEVTEFSEKVFWFLLQRNRSTCGIKPYIRATCNPDPESWVAELLAWWIDQETGFPISERDGVLRWLVRVDGQMHWFDSEREALDAYPENLPKSITFIRARVQDNVVLMERDPGYIANLMAQSYAERMRNLEGNWKVRASAGEMFPHDKWKMIPRDVFMAKAREMRFVRSWDKAGTEGGKGARTAGVLVAGPKNSHQGPFFIVNAKAGRWGDEQREAEIKVTADIDAIEYGSVNVLLEKEPGSGGGHSARMTIRNLAGHVVTAERPSGPKVSRWRALSSQQRAENVYIVEGDWDIPGFISELDALSGDDKIDKQRLKDLADAAGAGFNHLTAMYGRGVLEGPLLVDEGDTDYDSWSSKDKEAMPEFLRDICDSVGTQWDDYQ